MISLDFTEMLRDVLLPDLLNLYRTAKRYFLALGV